MFISSMLILHHIKAKVLNISFNLFYQPCWNLYFRLQFTWKCYCFCLWSSITISFHSVLILKVWLDYLGKNCYFQSSFSYSELLVFLGTFYEINLTLRHLHRLLREQNLFRRYHFTNSNDIIEVIQREMSGSGENLGYRTMHQKLRMKGVVTNRETICLIIKTLDPLGVELRKSNKLKRPMYTSRGPNFMWHMDGYNKIKSLGLPIHGCIDGYSRKIHWLN